MRGPGAGVEAEIALASCCSNKTPAWESMAYHAMRVTFRVCGAVTGNLNSARVRIIYAESEAAVDAAYVTPRRDGLKRGGEPSSAESEMALCTGYIAPRRDGLKEMVNVLNQ
jgi:hypothetical protein